MPDGQTEPEKHCPLHLTKPAAQAMKRKNAGVESQPRLKTKYFDAEHTKIAVGPAGCSIRGRDGVGWVVAQRCHSVDGVLANLVLDDAEKDWLQKTEQVSD